MPLAVGFEDVEVVFAVTEFHAREWRAILTANDLQLSVLILWFVTREELIVLGEIADHVLRRIDAKHLRHARLRPVAINAAMTAAAGIRSRIRWQILRLYDRLFLHWLGRFFRFRLRGAQHKRIEVATSLWIECLINHLQVPERLRREFVFLPVDCGEIFLGLLEIAG